MTFGQPGGLQADRPCRWPQLRWWKDARELTWNRPTPEEQTVCRLCGDAERSKAFRIAGLLPSSLWRLIWTELDLVKPVSPIMSVALIGDLHHAAQHRRDHFEYCRWWARPAMMSFLDFVDQIGGKLPDAADRKDVVRRRTALDDEVALFRRCRHPPNGWSCSSGSDTRAAPRSGRPGSIGCDACSCSRGQKRMVPAISAMIAASFGTRLEQFRDARQTAGDVARLVLSVEIRARMSPESDMALTSTDRMASTGQHQRSVAATRSATLRRRPWRDRGRRSTRRRRSSASRSPRAWRLPVDSSGVSEIGWLGDPARIRSVPSASVRHRTGGRIPFGNTGAALDHVAFVGKHPRAGTGYGASPARRPRHRRSPATMLRTVAMAVAVRGSWRSACSWWPCPCSSASTNGCSLIWAAPPSGRCAPGEPACQARRSIWTAMTPASPRRGWPAYRRARSRRRAAADAVDQFAGPAPSGSSLLDADWWSASTWLSSISVPRLMITLLEAGSRTSSQAVRPRMRRTSEPRPVPASMMAHILMPSLVPVVLRGDAVLRHVEPDGGSGSRSSAVFLTRVHRSLRSAVGRDWSTPSTEAFALSWKWSASRWSRLRTA